MTTVDFLIKDYKYNLAYYKEAVAANLKKDFSKILERISNCKNKQELISFSNKLEKLGLLH